jgi:uncharacterized protein (TIGR02217 family)
LEKLDLGYDYGAIGGLSFRTTAIATNSGYEKRNQQWAIPLGAWQLGDRSGENALTDDQYKYLSSFHLAMRGSAKIFLYKDWNDFQLDREQIGVGNGSNKNFQLTKTYRVGAESFVRPIKCPKLEGAIVQVGAARLGRSDYSLNQDTGILTLNTAPFNGEPVFVSCDFFVPCRFEQDKLEARFEMADVDQGIRLYGISSLSVVEVRV